MLGKTVKQTTSSSTMLGIVFQDLACGNSFKNLIKCDALLNHFLLGVLCDAKVLHISLSAYPFLHSLQVSDISFIFRDRHWMGPFTQV